MDDTRDDRSMPGKEGILIREPIPADGANHITHIHHYHAPVNNVCYANNSNFGVNSGTIGQTTHLRSPSPPPNLDAVGAEPHPAPPSPSTRAGVTAGEGSEARSNVDGWQVDEMHTIAHTLETQGLLAVLKPVPDASHTRNPKISPLDSACFPGTRLGVTQNIRIWADSSLIFGDHPHILWIYGYAGCGKSAIAQEMATYFKRKGRLVGDFFFFRGAGDRATVRRFATTIASQLAAAVPSTVPYIKAAIRANPNLLTSETVSLTIQFQRLIYEPFSAATLDRLVASVLGKPFLIVLDGLDECADHNEVATVIDHMIQFFRKKPRIPLRILITSRVESHLHQYLHSSEQVRLLDLVSHTSDEDISMALDVAIEREKGQRIMKCDPPWPSPSDKQMLVQHIGGSYIFMTTILKLLFGNQSNDGLTPMDRLPLILRMHPDFDGLYRTILTPGKTIPHFRDILSTIALAQESLSISQIANLLELRTLDVVNVLINLHAIMQVPGDDHSPITLWHTSLRDFLTSEECAGSFFASPIHHRCIADGAIRVAMSSGLSKSHQYARRYGMEHLFQYLKSIDQEKTPYDVLLGGIMLDLVKATFQDDKTALEVACHANDWKLVQALVNAGANVNTQFQGEGNDIRVALHAACHYKAKEMVYFLLEKGADPNIATSRLSSWGFSAFPLAWAAAQGDVDLVNRLLACGADPNLKGGWFGSALHACVYKGKDEVARVLLEHGADVNIKDVNDWTPLHYASLNGHIKVTKCLLEFNADPNLQDNHGDTPLHDACSHGQVEVAEFLLDHNADPSIRNKKGETALQRAQEQKEQKVVEMLLQRGITR